MTITMRLFLMAVLLFVGVIAEKKRFDGHRVVRAYPKTVEDLKALHAMEMDTLYEELDFWTEPSRIRPIDIRVSPNDYERFRAAITEAGINFEIINENLQIDLEKEAESMMRSNMRNTGLCNFFNTYCDFDQVYENINYFATNYPNNVDVTTIGYTYEGRPILQVKVAEDLNNPKPAIILESATHAREWITVSSTLYMIHKFLESPTTNSTFMLSKYDWIIIPVHNPDGYVYSHNADRLWRKNRRPCNNQNVGVDLNRNWDAGWGGASSNCRDITYQGTAAFSEPETEALMLSALDNGNVFAFFAIHCYGEMLIVPYAYKNEKPPNYNTLYSVGLGMASAIRDVDGRNYFVGTAGEILYLATGGSDDFFLESGIADFSYTYELRPSLQTSGGFVLPTNQIPTAIEELFVSLQAFVYLA